MLPPPSRIEVIPISDFGIFDKVSAALREEGIQIRVTKTSDQVGTDGQPLDPEREVKIALTGASVTTAPEAGDAVMFEVAVNTVLTKREKYIGMGLAGRPGMTRALDSAIHLATSGAGLEKHAARVKAELPQKLAPLNEEARRLGELSKELRQHRPK